jgi:hypothetical protein
MDKHVVLHGALTGTVRRPELKSDRSEAVVICPALSPNIVFVFPRQKERDVGRENEPVDGWNSRCAAGPIVWG